MSIFAKSNDGKVHLISGWNEFDTFCGHEGGWEECVYGPVTCEKCLEQIERVELYIALEQLRTTPCDPNMVITSGPHFDMNDFKPENLKQ